MKKIANKRLFDKIAGQVRGRLTLQKPMKPITWLGVGGEAECFYQPYDLQDLSNFLSILPESVDVLPVGVCSNLLVGDNGIPDVTIRLGGQFSRVDCDNDLIIAGAGLLDSRIADFAAMNGVDLSFLKTIPGTIGGAVKMNAGCYGTCIADVFESAEIVLRSGKIEVLDRAALNFSYRQSNLPKGAIVTKVTLKGLKSCPKLIENKMFKNQQKRVLSQPTKQKTGGSTFKNPSDGHSRDGKIYSAWQLIEKAKLRGFKVGGAQVSELHSNFLINTGSASAKDFESLGELIKKVVFKESGIKLEWEIKRVGTFNKIEKDFTKHYDWRSLFD